MLGELKPKGPKGPEGRVVGPSWEKLKPKGPKGPKGHTAGEGGVQLNLIEGWGDAFAAFFFLSVFFSFF